MISVQVGEQNIHIGDIVRVHNKVVEGEKVRTQIFEGMLINLRGRGINKTFTVRKIGVGGIGIERIWPLSSNSIVKIEVKKKAGKVRRAKLFYLRSATGKDAIKA